MVIVKPAEKAKMEVCHSSRWPAPLYRRHLRLRSQDYGSVEAFLPTLAPLLGQQVWQGESMSEGAPHAVPYLRRVSSTSANCAHAGGFAPGKVSVANVLTTGSRSTGGKTYYQYEILTRTADGDEGGRHHLFATTVSGGATHAMRLREAFAAPVLARVAHVAHSLIQTTCRQAVHPEAASRRQACVHNSLLVLVFSPSSVFPDAGWFKGLERDLKRVQVSPPQLCRSVSNFACSLQSFPFLRLHSALCRTAYM